MPKRSTEFQRLVLFLNKHNLPNLEITESKELIDKVSREKREVDIYISLAAGNYSMSISIECIEHKRKADISWVEMMKAKHDKLDTNQLVLVSKSGFTKQAIDVANHYRIKTFKYDQIEEDSSNPIFEFNSLFLKLVTQSIETVNFIVKTSEGKINDVLVIPETSVFDANSKLVGSASDIIIALMKNKEILMYFFNNGIEEHKYFVIEWVNNNTLPIFLQKEPELSLESIQKVKIIGKIEFKVSKFNTHKGKIDDTLFVWGDINLEGEKLMVLGTANDNKAKFSIFKR